MKKTILFAAILTASLFVSCEKETYGPTPNPTPSTGSSGGTNCSSAQCTGVTQAGARCKRMTTNCNRRCYQH